MKKFNCIYANGCSWTHGSELQGMHGAWPYIVAKELGVEAINNAEPGTSNDSIVRRTVDDCEEFIKRDQRPVVLIAWTHVHRFELPIGNSREEHYYKFVNPEDPDVPKIGLDIWRDWSNDAADWRRWQLQKRLLAAYLTVNDFTFYFFNTFNSLGTESFDILTLGLPQGPYRHPLEQGHQAIADFVLTKISRH